MQYVIKRFFVAFVLCILEYSFPLIYRPVKRFFSEHEIILSSTSMYFPLKSTSCSISPLSPCPPLRVCILTNTRVQNKYTHQRRDYAQSMPVVTYRTADFTKHLSESLLIFYKRVFFPEIFFLSTSSSHLSATSRTDV